MWTQDSFPRQLELGFRRQRQADRNHHLGGKSFYFFDFDDNVAHLSTPCFLFDGSTGEELEISSGEFAKVSSQIGKTGPYQKYEVDFCDRRGTFRAFRDVPLSLMQKLMGRKQTFVTDVAQALSLPDNQWKGPSWNCFFHAAYNQRPVSVITARGHSAETLKTGIKEFVKSGDLPQAPNYLAVFGVSNQSVREILGDKDGAKSVAELKKRAIKKSVDLAFAKYGFSPHHRFGMSDDDPKNIELIQDAMEELKEIYPENSFYVIETKNSKFYKREVERVIKQRSLQNPSQKEMTQAPLFVDV